MAGTTPAPPAGAGRSADSQSGEAGEGDDGGGFLSRWSRRKVQVRQGGSPADPVAVLPTAGVPAGGVLASRLGPEPGPASRLAPGQAVVPAATAPQVAAAPARLPATPPPPPPTLADVALLGRESDYARFVAPGVDAGVRNAALKKLFTDPHFNLMDGLDTYIDDYGKPDPLPAGMLRQMAQSQALGLFDDELPADSPDPDSRLAAANSPTPDVDPDPDISPTPRPDPAPALAHEPDRTPDEDADLRLQPHPAAGPTGLDPGAVQDAGRQH